MRRTILTNITIAFVLTGAALSGCSSETADKAGDAAESAKDDAAQVADDASARGQAEALRASLKGNDTANEEGIRSVKAIQQAADDLAGDPDVSGIDDGDDDGLDDDGKVQVTVDESSACLSLPESGENTEVTDDAC